MSEVRRALWVVAIVFGFAVVYQLFFRYQYVTITWTNPLGLSGPELVTTLKRVDRLTGQTCVVPCSDQELFPKQKSETSKSPSPDERSSTTPQPEAFRRSSPAAIDSSLGLTVRCAPESRGEKIPKPIYPTPQQVKEYVTSYGTMPVRGLREAFDAYRNGTADEDTVRSLGPYGSLFADHFRLLAIDRSLAGGYIINVQFTHHVDAIYQAWLYVLGGTQPSIRAFAMGRCSPAEQHWIATTFGPWAALGDDGSLMNGRPPSRPAMSAKASRTDRMYPP